MIRLVSENIFEEFIDLINNTKRSIKLISPFIGRNTANILSELISKKSLSASIITRFSRNDFFAGVSSISGLHKLLSSGSKIKAVKDLHTKLYIFDNDILIIGSSNFTNGGLINNVELNVLFSDEPEISKRAIEYFEDIDSKIDEQFFLDEGRIAKEESFLNSLGLSPKNCRISFNDSADFGAELRVKSKSDEIENVISLSQSSFEPTDSWVKFEGLVENRHPKDDRILKSRNNGVYVTNFPRRPTGIKRGDTVFLAMLSYNSVGQPMPMIYGYGISKGFSPNNEYTPEQISHNPLLERYSYFLELENLRVINAPASECVSISELYSAIGSSLFPTTRGKSINTDDLHHMHYRRDKMRITKDGKEFLLREINERIKIHGEI